MTPRLVLAYADDDLGTAQILYHRLKRDSFEPWMASEDLLPGEIVATLVPKRIRDADVVLACLSSHSANSAGGLQKHLRLALSKLAETTPGQIRAIPVRLDDCAVPDHAFEELGIRLRDIHYADVFDEAGYANLLKSLEHTGFAKRSSALAPPTGGHRAELLEAFEALCKAAENAFVANQRRSAKYLLEGFRSWQFALDDALDDPKLLSSLPQFLADRELDIVDELLGHYFNQNPTSIVLVLLNELSRKPGPLIRLDDQDLRDRLLASIDKVLTKIRSQTSGLGSADAKIAKRALLVIRSEVSAPRYNPNTVSAQRTALEGLQGRLVERPRLLTEALLAEGFPNLLTGMVFRYVPEIWCPQFVKIPDGEFLMGSPEDEAEREVEEGPRHEVTISKAFAFGRYAVTFEEYAHFCEVTGREKPFDDVWGRGRRPVVQVDYNDATAYCAWLAEVTGALCRLPTEAMWEYACRAGTMTPFSFGKTVTTDQVNVNGSYPYNGGVKGDFRKQTIIVGSLPKNNWGLHEMHGNVWEWVLDWLGEYSTDAVVDPQGAAAGSKRVARGGSWRSFAGLARSAYRNARTPEDRSDGLGFRCSCVPR